MTEIKFKAWDKKKKKMYRLIMDVVIDEDLIPDDAMESSRAFEWPEIYRVIQYTGCKDKNGKEVYEDYLVTGTMNMLKYTGKVVFERSGYFVEGKNEMIALCAFKNLKVIGNIFENPELLKENHLQEK